MGLGCNLNQDPMAHFAEPLQNPKPIDSKPDPELPLRSDAIRLEAPTSVTFREGIEGSMELGARILLPDYSLRMEVANIDQFPGATFDLQTGIFTWTPVKGEVVDGWTSLRELRVSIFADPLLESLAPLRDERIIQVTIERRPGVPLIDEVVFRADSIREGGSYDFTIKITDPDSTILESTAPKVYLMPPKHSFYPRVKSLVGYINFLERSPGAVAGTWEYKYRLNLAEQEVTASSDESGIDIQVVSRFGGESAVVPLRATVYTYLVRPVATVTRDALNLYVGQKVNHIIQIMDPKLEGNLKLVSDKVIQPAGSKFTCSSGSRGYLTCELNWFPTAQDKGGRVLDFMVESSNPDASDSRVVTQRFSQSLMVIDFVPDLPVESPGDSGEKPKMIAPTFKKTTEQRGEK